MTVPVTDSTNTIVSDVSLRLGQILTDGVDVHRCAAAQALGRFPVSLSGGLLEKALLDEDPDVRYDAVAALGGLGARDHAAALMENLLGDPDGKVKNAVIEALAAMKYAPASALFRDLVVSRAEQAGVVWDDGAFYQDGWDDWLDTQLAAIRGLGALQDAAGVQAISTALDSEDGQDVSEIAIPALIDIGPAGVAELERRYDGAPIRFRRRVAQALGQSGAGYLDPLKTMCLADPGSDVRLCAMTTVAAQDPGDSRLDALLSDPDDRVRAHAVALLGPVRPDATRAALSDPAAGVRKAGYGVIAGHPDGFELRDVIDRLETAFTDQVDISVEAANAWAALDPDAALEILGPVANDPNLPIDLRAGLLDTLKRIGQPAVPDLRLAAAGDERQIRLVALAALGELAAETGDTRDNPAALVLLEAVRGELVAEPVPDDPAEFVLPDVSEKDQADSDTDPDTDPDAGGDDTERSAESTLDAILSPPVADAVDPPAPLLHPLDAEDLRRLDLVETRKRGKKRMPLEPDTPAHLEIRRYAASMLGEVKTPAAANSLGDTLDTDDPDLVRAAFEALARLATAGCNCPEEILVPHILAALASDDAETRRLATRLAGHARTPAIRAALVAQLGDPALAIRLETVRALGACGAGYDNLKPCLGDAWPAVRLAAAEMLGREAGEAAFADLVELAFYQEGFHHREIAAILGRIAPGKAARAFLQVLGDEARKRVWLVAIEALDEIFAGIDPCQPPISRVA